MKLVINCDGGARGNPGPAASAFVVFDASGQIVHQQGKYLGEGTNNQAEYEAVLLAVAWLVQNYPQAEAEFFLDSQLVVNQLKGSFKVKDPELKIKYSQIKSLIENCKLSRRAGSVPAGKIVSFNYISRDHNFLVDTLVNQTLDEHISA